MTKEEFWMNAAIGDGPEWADSLLDEYEKRFGQKDYSLGNLPSVDAFEDGVMIEGCKVFTSYSDAYKQFVIKACYNGTWSYPRYTNCIDKTSLNAWMIELGPEVIKAAIEEVKND